MTKKVKNKQKSILLIIENLDNSIDKEILKLTSLLKAKRHSRVWFDPDTELLDAICEAEDSLKKVRNLNFQINQRNKNE